MSDHSTSRVDGNVIKLSLTWAIVRGDDGIDHFLMPTDVRPPNNFRDLVAADERAGLAGTRVFGERYYFKGRPRMRDVVVVTPSEPVHGETR